MRITASQIQLRNVGQLAQATTLEGVTIMGRLDGVAFSGDGNYILSIGRNGFKVPGDHPVDIRRSANLDALVNGNENTGDIADRLEADDAAA